MSRPGNSLPGSGAVPPAFDLPVPETGYRWWYLDGVSADGQHGIVIILFVGSVFSPYYYRARQRQAGHPEAHCALNVALYGKPARWCMTERTATSVLREQARFQLGPSSVSWDGDALRFQIDERCTPFAQRLRGEVLARPGAPCGLSVDLDEAGRHCWTPWSPHGTVEVQLKAPALAWKGSCYLDANAGSEPLESAFHAWDWSRTELAGGSRLHYELQRQDGSERLFAFDVDRDGQYRAVAADPLQAIRRTGWGLSRYPRVAHAIDSVQSYEDTPFYSRSALRGPLDHSVHFTVHERLDMDRFVRPWVRTLLPFRMPRIAAPLS